MLVEGPPGPEGPAVSGGVPVLLRRMRVVPGCGMQVEGSAHSWSWALLLPYAMHVSGELQG